uniref:Putative permease n=1 Tax=mine drainage metagenome TaxID=410659 RepID=E6Q066_9ZZZZ
MHWIWFASAESWLGGLSQVDWRLPWVVVAAFLAGTLNAVAGGGSFLSFPAMLSVGLGPIQANATNTVALWPGQLTSIAGYWPEVQKHKRLAVKMGAAGLVGGTAGAIVLLNTPAMTFMKLVPWLLLVAALIFAFSGPVTKWLQKRAKAGLQDAHSHKHRRYWPLVVMTAFVCFYIGYFGAGAGFLIISMLSLFGFDDLNQMNAMKVVSTTMANGVACILFAFSGKVEWRYCLAAMVTCGVGGYLSSRLAKRLNQQFLRGMVVMIGLTMAAYFFWKTY